MVCRATLFSAHLCKATGIGTVFPANHDHRIHFPCQINRRLLTLLRRCTYCHVHRKVRNFICQYLFNAFKLLLGKGRLYDHPGLLHRGQSPGHFFPI